MTDHKFTDDDVIKALECSVEYNERKNASCDGCPLEKVFPYCNRECSEDTLEVMYLALINRQKAEIERLKKGRKNIKFETGDYAKIADNKSGHEFEIGTIVKLEKHDEDYKAFANGDWWWVTDDDLVEVDNDTLVKEMTEK